MEYETKLLEREQYGEQKGREQGTLDILKLSKAIKNYKQQGFTDEEIFSQLNKSKSLLSTADLKELIGLIK